MASLKVRIAESVQGLGPRLSSRLRWLGIWELVLLLSAAALVSVGLDVWIELPLALRTAVLVAMIAGSVFVFLRARQRAGRAFELRELAAAVESRDETLDGHLANALDLPGELEEIERDRVAGRPGAMLETQLLKKALAESTQRALRAPVESALSGVPIWKRAAPAVLLTAALVYLSGAAPAMFRLWFHRNVLLSSELYPRKTHFVLDRPASEWHVATKDPLEIGGWVTGEVPRQVEIHLESGSGRRTATVLPGAAGQVAPEAKGQGSPSENDSAATTEEAAEGRAVDRRTVEGRRIVHLLGSVTEPLEFRFEGGDNESRTVRVVAHDRPRITTARFTLTFPAYLGREPSTVENPGGDLSIPAGTEVEIEAVSDQPLGSGSIRFGKEEPVAAEVRESSAFLKLKPAANGFIDLTVVSSEWSLESRPPLRFALVVVPDRAPSVTLALEGESRVMTPKGRIGFKVEAEDDHGLSGLALLKVTRPAGDTTPEDELKPVTEPLEGRMEQQAALVRSSASGEIALAPLGLAPGSSITLQAWAADNDALTGPKSATSEKETIVIVDPAELLKELEKVRVEAQSKLEDLSRREATVRDRLEAIASGKDGTPPPEEAPAELASAGDEPRDPRAAERAASSGRSPGGKRSTSKSPAGKAAATRAGAEESPEEGADSAAEEGSAEPSGTEREGAAKASGKAKTSAKTSSGKTAKGASEKAKNAAKPSEAGEEPPPEGAEPDAEKPEEPEDAAADKSEADPQGTQGKASAAKGSRAASKGASKRGGARPASARPSGQQASTSPDGAEESGNQEPKESPLSEMAREQTDIAKESKAVADKLRARSDALRRNSLIDPAEDRRLREEVEKPLDDLAEERLPESASELSSKTAEDRVPETAAEAGRKAEDLSREIKKVADRLAGSGDFREVLLRMERILELQRQAIGETEKRGGSQ